jgi:cytosine/adenosine deaminase-related metal-dependent hydrolase
MFEATRWASYLSRLRHVELERWVSADEVLAMATSGSATAIGFGDVIGRLAPGCAADIVFLDLADITYTPLNDVVRQIIFSESGAAIAAVMIAEPLCGRSLGALASMLARSRSTGSCAWATPSGTVRAPTSAAISSADRRKLPIFDCGR